jgi:NAD(P)-dependent dehydrogenase (short-subunit alcohol dehydrogenase family)
MIDAFADALARAAPARVVNVASYWAGDLDLHDLEFRRRRYDNGTAYRQSKQANRMLTVLEAERLAARGVSVNVCHPGDVNSTLSNSLGFGGSATPDEGAATPLWLATSPEVKDESGRYFERMRKVSCPFARDRESIERLDEACRRLSFGRG